ncbi:hypothetical protein BJ878DRAFT_118005 [Calycina marina]|uniref:Uncharacterized protein n=1 Tax=Calycina marina TaxID=1763456 RepID=A0A9P8CDU8_9HELO|nr:hypothetical protein BJ878DRAFT_118005 [Calycina marina]
MSARVITDGFSPEDSVVQTTEDTKMEDVQIEELPAPAGEPSVPIPAPAPTLVAAHPNRISKEEGKTIVEILGRFTAIKDEDDNELLQGFQRLVSKKSLPDYFEVIKEPIAFSTIRAKIIKKQYKNFREFVRDVAQIAHNAQVYNRPSAQIFSDAETLRALFRAELKKLVDAGTITAEIAELPYLGELPEFEDSPPPGPDDEEEEEADGDEDEDDDDDDEEEDVTDDDRPRKKRRGRRPSSSTAKKTELGDKEDPEAVKKRGRPPKVMTPMEARINNILKGLRKSKRGSDLMVLPFERLPDKIQMPEYYQEIKNPIAMDLIKKKAKRKKYQSVDQVIKDLTLLFDNAKSYNLPGSDIYKDANQLLREALVLAEQEKNKPDSDFVDEDGRLPVREILYNDEVWKVGDWIHIANLNDVTKPIVAQIYRTWQDPEGQKWINACWYYRPEQTVHRYEKHFFDHEVVKTGQYRDHKIEEVIDRCFVMFFTRYNKGRPRGFPADKEVYVCEARYNEEKYKLNKIKTWASCVPDEVRDKDYEMDLFDSPRKMKKVPSPIKHLLREDAKEDDPLPKPTWGVPNAPPIVGAVHKRPREANESPPPEPTPPPPSPKPTSAHQPVVKQQRRTYDETAGDIMMSGMALPLISEISQSPGPSQVTINNQYGQQFAQRPSASPAPQLQTQSSYGSQGGSMHLAMPQTPIYPAAQQQQSYQPHYSASTPVTANNISNYNYQQHTQTAPRPAMQHSSSHNSNNAYNPPRQVEVYTLSDQANASIPPDVREQFHRDEYGRVVFYTAPPVVANPIVEDQQDLGHSLRYLADKARSKEAEDKKRKERADELEQLANEKRKLIKENEHGEKQAMNRLKLQAIVAWSDDMDRGTDQLYMNMLGDDWETARKTDTVKLIAAQKESAARNAMFNANKEARRKKREEIPINGYRPM